MKSGLNSISLWFGLITLLIIVSGAMAITFTDFLSDRLYGSKRVFFVVLLLAYAVYRGFRIYQALKQKDYEK